MASEHLGDVAGNACDTITLDGVRYGIGELRLGDYADFEQSAKQRLKKLKREKMDMAKEAYGSGAIPAEVFREIVAPPTQAEIEAETETITGTAFLLHRALQKADPTMTEEKVRGLVSLTDIPRILESIGAKAEEPTDPKNASPPA